MAKRKHKGANGVGENVSVSFDISDPQERKALRAAQLLAAKHGRRKAAIVTFLCAVADHYDRCNVLPTPLEIAAALTGFDVPRPPMGFTPGAPTVIDSQPDLRRLTTPRADDTPQYVPTDLTVSKGKKASAEDVAATFLKSYGGFFD
jgi:hypothetical protein